MRRIVAPISALVVLIACTLAQYGDSSDLQSQTKNLIIVEGCLSETYGNYNLTDPSGASYQLTGKTDKLRGHVGQTVRVTATSAPMVSVPGSMSEVTEKQPGLSVITFKRLSGPCTNGANNIP